MSNGKTVNDTIDVDVEVMPEFNKWDLLVLYSYFMILFVIVPGTFLLTFIGCVLKMVKETF